MPNQFERPTAASVEKKPVVESAEELAQKELDEILEDSENSFLNTIPQNAKAISEASTAVEALAYAKKKIEDRLARTFHMEMISSGAGIEPVEISFQGIKRTVSSIIKHAHEIGRGGDGFVVVDKNEIRTLPPEICYKFAIAEQTPRGRNTVTQEAEIHGAFYDASLELPDSKIGVPIPFYSLEMGDKKMIAMEKLNAASLDDILRGRAPLPSWFDVDEYCEELKKMIAHFHEKHLYHRDMHIGNIMISQSKDHPPRGEKIGYIIDFGLSGNAYEEMEPYRREVAGTVFTYINDYGIIDLVKHHISELRKRRHDEVV